MGDIAPSKMPSAKERPRRDNTDFTVYAKGGWIAEATKNKGGLHRQMGIPAGEKIPAKKLAKAAQAGGKLGQRARLAETLKGLK